MTLKIVITIATLSLILLASHAFAAEGAGDPFPFRASPQSSNGHVVAADTGSEHFPALTGEVVQQPALTAMAAPNGREGAAQALNSLPHGFEEGTVAYAQARRLENYAQRVSSRREAALRHQTLN